MLAIVVIQLFLPATSFFNIFERHSITESGSYIHIIILQSSIPLLPLPLLLQKSFNRKHLLLLVLVQPFKIIITWKLLGEQHQMRKIIHFVWILAVEYPPWTEPSLHYIIPTLLFNRCPHQSRFKVLVIRFIRQRISAFLQFFFRDKNTAVLVLLQSLGNSILSITFHAMQSLEMIFSIPKAFISIYRIIRLLSQVVRMLHVVFKSIHNFL